MILGIDIGGTKIRTWDGRNFQEFDTPKNKKDFMKILNKFNDAKKIGVAVAGVTHGSGVAIAPNIRYLKNFDFRKVFKTVRVDNDARCFLRAELATWRFHRQVLGVTIGTGFGRAISGKKIKSMEFPVKWEKEYQKLRDKKDDIKLGNFLTDKLNPIIKKYKARNVILGGGVIHREKLFEILKNNLDAKVFKAKFLPRSGAIGAAMLWK